MKNQRPKGCVHPDCFHCQLNDCKMDKGMKESAEINAVLKCVLHPKEEGVK